MACWILLVSGFGFLSFVFACLALFRIGPAALKVHVKVSPWSLSASVEMGDGRTNSLGISEHADSGKREAADAGS